MYQMITKSLLDLDVNNEIQSVIARPSDTLLDVLREQLHLTGAKNSCENGDCNSCTILMDGWPVKACQILAVETVGHKLITIEGLRNTPIQQAFIDKFALQCGFCTPGFIINCHALINIHPDADDQMINEWLGSNLCRCTSYSEIKEAVTSVLSK